MPVETATYISDLVPANPLTTDAINQGDDHLRLVKQVLQTTLPGANAPITATPANLNNGYVPVGGIVLWSGSIGSIPTNWHLCDGTTGTPDLRARFLIGAGPLNPVGQTGGALTTSSDGSHSHTGVTGGHSLTVSELPTDSGGGAGTSVTTSVGDAPVNPLLTAHTHPISVDGDHTHSYTPPYYALAYIMRVT